MQIMEIKGKIIKDLGKYNKIVEIKKEKYITFLVGNQIKYIPIK